MRHTKANHKVLVRRSSVSRLCALVVCLSFSPVGFSQSASYGAGYPAQRFITVAPDVKLEVLDWGGSGRNLVLLAGGGNTAHVYASLAPKLAKQFHVYGITRRGAGQSSAPSTGYTARQFGNDIIAVLDALHLQSPVLVGHSIAGEEMSSVSEHHPGRVSALIYLDAGGPFALYDPEHGNIDLDRVELQQDLSRLGKDSYDNALITKTLADEARYRRNLQDLRDEVEGASAPVPTKFDLASVGALQRYFAGYYGGTLPEDEIRQHYKINTDGSVGERLSRTRGTRAQEFEYERFSKLDTRALVIIPFPNALNSGVTHDPARLAAYKAQEASRKQGQLGIWRKQPHVQVVVIPNVTHYIFLSDEAEILALISRFLRGLAS